MREIMTEPNRDETSARQPLLTVSGIYEYTLDLEQSGQCLQIFSSESMSSTFQTAQETLDLLRFLQSHQTELEAAALHQAEEAQKPKRKKSVEDRLNDLLT
jgi:hypothetical protein